MLRLHLERIAVPTLPGFPNSLCRFAPNYGEVAIPLVVKTVL